MAIGDIKEIPVRITKQITIGAGGTSLDWNVEYPITFDPSQWSFIGVEVDITANQSYLPLVPFSEVVLENSYAIRNTASDGTFTDSPLGNNTIEWAIISASYTKTSQFTTAITGSLLSKVSIYNTHVYKLPVVAITPQNCTVTTDCIFIFKSKVASATVQPTLATPKQSGGATNLDLGWVLVVGVIGVAGLLALGFAAEKTGLNVGSIGTIVKPVGDAMNGAAKAISDAIHVR